MRPVCSAYTGLSHLRRLPKDAQGGRRDVSVGGANRETGVRKPGIGSDVAQPGFSGLLYGETEAQRRLDGEMGHFPTGKWGN